MARDYLAEARAAAHASRDPDRVGAWLLAELVAKRGRETQAARARARLARLPAGGLDAALARGLDADVHGRFNDATAAYLALIRTARSSARPDAALLAWFAANRLGALRAAVGDLWDTARATVEEAMAHPGAIGWRARAELVDWWSREVVGAQTGVAPDRLFETIAARQGCLRAVALAGPFGHGAPGDHRVHFEAERPAPWPADFAADPVTGRRPRQLDTQRHGCLIAPAHAAPIGVYYAQSFVNLSTGSDVIVAVQGAHALLIDDTEVLTRDLASWGVWPRFGVRLRLAAGRHRLLARLVGARVSMRLLGPTGEPLGLVGSTEQATAYVLDPPTRLAEPNVLEPFMQKVGVGPVHGSVPCVAAIDTEHPVARYLAAHLAHVEGQDDLAEVLIEPLVADRSKATAPALAEQALFVDGDPIFSPAVAQDLARDLRELAAGRDKALWGPRLWLALAAAKGEQSAATVERTERLERLAARFTEVPAIVKRLAAAYGRLGWHVEHTRTLERGAQHFPRDTEVLEALVVDAEAHGKWRQADELAARIRQLDPRSEVDFRRALRRRDYDAATAELRRIARLRPDRHAIAMRLADLLVRAGKSSKSMEKLELALRRDPADPTARLALADARYAAGAQNALIDALVEAIRTGAPSKRLRQAIELVEGMTDFAPYRRDGLAFIRDIERQGVKMKGMAARLLDYAVLWVGHDGRARMLEHEIIRLQSREAIERHAEQQVPRGVLLQLRTIKSDGRVFEPELVAGKPTITMSHLEVGDYVETESIWTLGSGSGGRRFLSPRWYFRERDTSYYLSEFVVVAPHSHPLVVESTAQVPEPQVRRAAGLDVWRWQVRGSRPLPSEPLSAPMQEFLPSVRVGWGIDLPSQLRRIADRQHADYPRDPRMVRIATTLVRGKLSGHGDRPIRVSIDERARRIYRWVLDTIEPGKEQRGPRIVTAKSGNRSMAFVYLCRMAGIDARVGLVRDRLTPPPAGPFSAAQSFSVPAVRVATERGSRWLVVQNRFAPYGFLPSSLRGQPAVILQPAHPITVPDPPPVERETTSSAGHVNEIVHRGEVELRRDGSGHIELRQHYHGRYAIRLRSALGKVLPARRKELVESELLGLAFPGGRVTKLDILNLDELDEPLALSMTIEVPNLARQAANELVLNVPFSGDLSPLVQLPRRETPLYVAERFAGRTSLRLKIHLPQGATLSSGLKPRTVSTNGFVIESADRLKKGVLVIDRKITIPAGRIQPDRYVRFRNEILAANDVARRTVRIRLP